MHTGKCDTSEMFLPELWGVFGVFKMVLSVDKIKISIHTYVHDLHLSIFTHVQFTC